MVYSNERKQLVDAARSNDLETIKLLVEKKNIPLSPIVAHIAAENGYMDLLLYVVERKPDVLENKDEFGNTVLHLAIEKNAMDLQTLQFLAEEKQAPLIKTNDARRTIARIAAMKGRMDLLKYVAEKKPFILSKKDVYGKTILHMADEANVMALIEFLEEKYHDNIPTWHRAAFEGAAIRAAIELGHWKVLKYFLEEKESDVDSVNDMDEPPIFSALKNDRYDMFKYLIEDRKADLTLLNDRNENILFVALRKDDLPTMKYVLDERKADIDINWRNENGNALLHEAAIMDQNNMIEYLIEERHANISLPALNGDTPLHIAASRCNHKGCKYLIEHGADPFAKDEADRYPSTMDHDQSLERFLRNTRMKRDRRCIDLIPARFDITRHEWNKSPPYFVNRSAGVVKNSSNLLNFLMVAASMSKNVRISTNNVPVFLDSKIDFRSADIVQNTLYSPYRGNK